MQSAHLPRRERSAVRAILLDPAQRVLLLRGRDPAAPQSAAWWFTPGGGRHAAEDPGTALRRECWEELGFVPDRFIGPLAHRRYEFPFDDHWLVQQTEYYAAAVPAFRPTPQALSELEQRVLLGWRWWPRSLLDRSAETIYPTDLADLIAAAIAEPSWPPATA